MRGTIFLKKKTYQNKTNIEAIQKFQSIFLGASPPRTWSQDWNFRSHPSPTTAAAASSRPGPRGELRESRQGGTSAPPPHGLGDFPGPKKKHFGWRLSVSYIHTWLYHLILNCMCFLVFICLLFDVYICLYQISLVDFMALPKARDSKRAL